MKRRMMALAAALAAALTLATPGVAYAGTSAAAWYGSGGVSSAFAYFEDHGEYTEACDYQADGHSAVAHLQAYIDGTYQDYRSVWATGGNNTCSQANDNLNEGQYVRIRACIGEAGPRTIIACGPWAYGMA
ncbi:hypothetical protein ACQSSU_12955 [Micromonospora echinospora]